MPAYLLAAAVSLTLYPVDRFGACNLKRANGLRANPGQPRMRQICCWVGFFRFDTANLMSEKIWRLQSCDLFQRLAPEDLSRLEACSRARNFARKSPIYLPAEDAEAVLLLVSGRAKICSFTADGKQAILGFIEPGELFGELAVFGDGKREEYAEAVENSLVVLIPGDAIFDLMQKRPDLSLGVTKLMGLRRRRIERRLKNLLFRSNRERLVHLLLELAEQYGRATLDGAVALGIKLSHQDLANVIGSTRETVTVLLGEMQEERYLTLGRRKITITRLDSLAKSVETTPPELKGEAPRPAPSRPGC